MGDSGRPAVFSKSHLRRGDVDAVNGAFADQWERRGDPGRVVPVLCVDWSVKKQLMGMHCDECGLRGTPLAFWNEHTPELCTLARAELRQEYRPPEKWTLTAGLAKQLGSTRAAGWRASAQVPAGWGAGAS